MLFHIRAAGMEDLIFLDVLGMSWYHLVYVENTRFGFEMVLGTLECSGHGRFSCIVCWFRPIEAWKLLPFCSPDSVGIHRNGTESL
jgi:hypothetical protein